MDEFAVGAEALADKVSRGFIEHPEREHGTEAGQDAHALLTPVRVEHLTDDQLGLPIDRALRNVADRMKSRDMRQVGLIGELQRTAGGNAAEVLDTVVATVRERAEVRRLAQTLTAQGRMARWILSVLPVVLGLLMFGASPQLMKPMLTSSGGQVALVFAALLAVAGSLWIKKIVEIEV